MSYNSDHEAESEINPDGESSYQQIQDEYEAEVARINKKYKRGVAIERNRAYREAVANGEIEARPKRLVHKRDKITANERLMNDYFNDNPVYSGAHFRRRFRMNRPLFLRIVEAVTDFDPRFNQRLDAALQPGFTAIQQVSAAIRFLATGMSADSLDDQLRMAPTTLFGYVDRFLDAIIAVFEDEYLRKPNDADMTRLTQEAKGRGFPGMLGSIDCMHWTWKNCPKAWAGQYTNGYKKKPSIILEAVCGYDTWIWHAFFGVPGANNDINTLQQSPVLDDMLNGTAPQFTYEINGRQYNRGYYLGDGIYPSYTCFVKSIGQPCTPAQVVFKKLHDNYRKDIERCFGILQARWHIIANPAKGWSANRLAKTMKACILMHNMIVEDERDHYRGTMSIQRMMQEYELDEDWRPHFERHDMNDDNGYETTNAEIRNRQAHMQLQEDLCQHVYRLRPDLA